MHNFVNGLKDWIEHFKGWSEWYMNYISIKKTQTNIYVIENIEKDNITNSIL